MSHILEGFDISVADKEDCLEILAEPQLLAAINLTSPSELPAYLAESRFVYFLIEYGSYRMLFHYTHKEAGLYEAHMACPKDSILASRALTLAGLLWVFSLQNIEAKGIITDCPKGKIANMLKKIGGKAVGSVGAKQYFLFTNPNVPLTNTNS